MQIIILSSFKSLRSFSPASHQAVLCRLLSIYAHLQTGRFHSSLIENATSDSKSKSIKMVPGHLTPDSSRSGSLKHKMSIDSMDSRSKRMNANTYKLITIGELPQDLFLPPLPPIENGDIEKRVFSHSSLFSNAKSGLKFEEEDHELVDNEKLEWIGDGILSQ